VKHWNIGILEYWKKGIMGKEHEEENAGEVPEPVIARSGATKQSHQMEN
jgi:hypothetical protein